MKKGILITILVFVIIIIFLALMGGYIYMQFTKEPYVPGNAFLTIDLSGKIADSDTSAFSKHKSVRDLWYHLNRAKIDPRIKGVLLKISWLSTGFAKVEDIGRLVKDFRTSGKKVYAFIEGAGAKGYYLSTFADKVYVFKGGELFLTGLASEAMFLKDTFSLIGVEADFFHVGDYKTAANMFTKDHMTPAHREAMDKLLNDIHLSVMKGVAANRNVDIETVKRVFDEFPTGNQFYLDNKLVDGILYEDEVIARAEGAEAKYSRVSFDTYKDTRSPLPFEGIKKIAVIFAAGEIHRGTSGGKSMFGGEVLGSDSVVEQLRSARKNRFIKAVVLRIDSPGGSAPASDAIRREAELLAKEKPLVISMADMAASGGYWISMASRNIMALPQTMTGSIGVVGGKFVLKGLYDKIGVKKEMVATSKYAGMFTDYRKFNDQERAKIQAMMNGLYQSFLEVVSQNRAMEKDEVHKIAQGRVWAGSSALDLKLVDRIGGLNDAIAEAKKLAEIPDSEEFGVSVYPKKRSVLDVVYDYLGANAELSIDPMVSIKAKLAMYKRFFPAMMVPFKISIN
ncbi:MAG: signal peptide peptidase SppA [bacterium]|nr:signal peptide peptidase SppA [bacterium]